MSQCTQRALLRILANSVVILVSAWCGEATAQLGAPSSGSGALSADTAQANAEVDVDALIRNGIAAYKERDYENAATFLGQAWASGRSPTVAATLAAVEVKLKRFRAAAEHWSAYMRGLPDEQQAARAEALEQVQLCRKYVALVKLRVEPASAVVVVDSNEHLSAAADGEVWLEPGEHTLLARVDSRQSPIAALTVTAGDETSVALTVPQAPAAVAMRSSITVRRLAQPVAPKPAPGNAHGVSAKTVVLIGESLLTLTALGIGTGYVLAVRAADRDAADLLAQAKSERPGAAYACAGDSRPSVCNELAARINDSVSAAKVVNVAMPTAAVLGAITVGTYFLWPSKKLETSAASSIRVVPWWTPATQGAAMLAIF